MCVGLALADSEAEAEKGANSDAEAGEGADSDVEAAGQEGSSDEDTDVFRTPKRRRYSASHSTPNQAYDIVNCTTDRDISLPKIPVAPGYPRCLTMCHEPPECITK